MDRSIPSIDKGGGGVNGQVVAFQKSDPEAKPLKASDIRYRIMDAVWQDPAAPWDPYERAVAQVIANCFREERKDDHGYYAFPGAAYVAKRAGMSLRKAEDCLRTLRTGRRPKKNGQAPPRDPSLLLFEARPRSKRVGKEHSGFQYYFASNPVALAVTLDEYERLYDGIKRKIEGKAIPRSERPGPLWEKGGDYDMEADSLREKSTKLKQRHVRREIDVQTYARALSRLDREMRDLAHRIAASIRHSVPGRSP